MDILAILLFSQECSTARFSINQIWANLWCDTQSALAWIALIVIIAVIGAAIARMAGGWVR